MSSRRPPGLPFAHLNLRRNPFGEFSLDQWAQLAVVEVDRWVQQLMRPRAVVQFLGEKGSGKTTHLLAICERFDDAGYVHIPEGERRAVPAGHPVLVDEAQRLTAAQRRRLFACDVPLVLATHRDFSAQLRRCGRSVTAVAVEQQMSSHRLERLLNRRMSAARRSAGPIPRVSQSRAEQLLANYGPNVRQILHQLYAEVQGLHRIRDL